jgi:predicted nucleotidyltransferase
MITKVNKWGNSLGIRIPKKIVDKLQLVEGKEIEFTYNEKDEVVLNLYNPDLTIDEISRKASVLFKYHNIEKAWLFGSYARGNMTNRSDIDLVIDFGNISVEEYMELTYIMTEELKILLGKDVDIINSRKITNQELSIEIEKEGILIYDRT